MGTDHSLWPSVRRPVNDLAAVQQPAPLARRVADPVLDLVVGTSALEVFGDRPLLATTVVRMDQLMPGFDAVGDVARLVTQHAQAARRAKYLGGAGAPVPQAVLGVVQGIAPAHLLVRFAGRIQFGAGQQADRKAAVLLIAKRLDPAVEFSRAVAVNEADLLLGKHPQPRHRLRQPGRQASVGGRPTKVPGALVLREQLAAGSELKNRAWRGLVIHGWLRPQVHSDSCSVKYAALAPTVRRPRSLQGAWVGVRGCWFSAQQVRTGPGSVRAGAMRE